jgi:hypothetical protein
MDTCPFKDALGVPGTGVHALRFAGLAVNDTLMTIIAAVLTSYAFHINLWLSLFLWFLVGELLHYGFGVNSAFLKMIGLSPKCDAP